MHRIAAELETMIVELGVDARLLRLQLDEVYGEVDDELDLVGADYPRIASGYTGAGLDADAPASPRGLRLLARVARVTPGTAIAVVERFGELARLQRATVDELTSVMGVDHDLAASIKDTLDRLTKTSILDQYS